MDLETSSSSFPDLRVTSDSEYSDVENVENVKNVKPIKKRRYKKRKRSPKLTYKYTMEEITEAVNLLNAKETFFDKPHKFENVFCIQNIYKYDCKREKALDSLNCLFQEAVACLENQDWETLVQIIIKALQFPMITRSLVKNFVLMEILYDPALKNSEIARRCLSLMFGANIKHEDLIKRLTQVPNSVERILSDEEESESEATES